MPTWVWRALRLSNIVKIKNVYHVPTVGRWYSLNSFFFYFSQCCYWTLFSVLPGSVGRVSDASWTPRPAAASAPPRTATVLSVVAFPLRAADLSRWEKMLDHHQTCVCRCVITASLVGSRGQCPCFLYVCASVCLRVYVRASAIVNFFRPAVRVRFISARHVVRHCPNWDLRGRCRSSSHRFAVPSPIRSTMALCRLVGLSNEMSLNNIKRALTTGTHQQVLLCVCVCVCPRPRLRLLKISTKKTTRRLIFSLSSTLVVISATFCVGSLVGYAMPQSAGVLGIHQSHLPLTRWPSWQNVDTFEYDPRARTPDMHPLLNLQCCSCARARF